MSEHPDKLSPQDSNYLEVLEHFYSISEEAVNEFNSASENGVLTLHKLPPEFLEIFLDISVRRGGFCIISPTRLVVFFDEEPQIITVIGKLRNANKAHNISSSKAAQLLKVSFTNDSGEYEYRDNTAGKLLPYDVVSLLIKWVTA